MMKFFNLVIISFNLLSDIIIETDFCRCGSFFNQNLISTSVLLTNYSSKAIKIFKMWICTFDVYGRSKYRKKNDVDFILFERETRLKVSNLFHGGSP